MKSPKNTNTKTSNTPIEVLKKLYGQSPQTAAAEFVANFPAPTSSIPTRHFCFSAARLRLCDFGTARSTFGVVVADFWRDYFSRRDFTVATILHCHVVDFCLIPDLSDFLFLVNFNFFLLNSTFCDLFDLIQHISTYYDLYS